MADSESANRCQRVRCRVYGTTSPVLLRFGSSQALREAKIDGTSNAHCLQIGIKQVKTDPRGAI
jgi:hypothetical protein